MLYMKKPHNLAEIKTKQVFYDDLGLENMGGNGYSSRLYIYLFFMEKKPMSGFVISFFYASLSQWEVCKVLTSITIQTKMKS